MAARCAPPRARELLDALGSRMGADCGYIDDVGEFDEIAKRHGFQLVQGVNPLDGTRLWSNS
jgi:hypothetical protein